MKWLWNWWGSTKRALPNKNYNEYPPTKVEDIATKEESSVSQCPFLNGQLQSVTPAFEEVHPADLPGNQIAAAMLETPDPMVPQTLLMKALVGYNPATDIVVLPKSWLDEEHNQIDLFNAKVHPETIIALDTDKLGNAAIVRYGQHSTWFSKNHGSSVTYWKP